MKIVNGKGVALGRIASYAAKESLKGEEISIVNCDEVIITGNFETTKKDFQERRSRVGSSQKGPKLPSTSEKIVKRAVRGMLPNYREGRGRVAYKRVMCYSKIPKECEGKELIEVHKDKKMKYSEVKKFTK
ncbi:MAG: 50S ribosomal protein L13 [Nanoarchaeota archaeon]|nr:50S ribosomal protein L13 [Nanoarchaeota archaeon]